MTVKRTAALAMAFLTVACSDGGTGPGSEPATFTAEYSAYAPYSTAVLKLNGVAPTSGIAGTFGTEPVTLLPAGDSAVVFMVPVASGAQQLVFAINGREYAGTISVMAHTPVAQPVEYLESAAGEAEAMVSALELEIAQDTAPLDPDAAALLQLARDSLAAFRAHMAALTPEQAQQVADVVRAVRAQLTANETAELRAGVMHATAQGMIPQECGTGSALDMYACTWREFIQSAAKATVALGAAGVAVEVFAPFPIVAFATGSFFAVYAGVHGVRALDIGRELLTIHFLIAVEVAKLAGDAVWQGGTALFRTTIVDDDVAPDLNGFGLAALSRPPTTMTSFTNTVTASFTFEPQVRPVQAVDRVLPVDWLVRGLDLIARYNRFVSRFGSRYQLEFSPPATSYLPPVPHDEISIEILAGNVRLGSIGGAGSRVDVLFEATAPGEQDFTYDIVYNSGVYPEMRVRYEATLHPATYRLGALADTTLLGDTITMIGGGVQNMYFLMLENGSLAEGHYSLQNMAPVPGSVAQFAVAGNGGHYVHLYGRLPLTNVTADTFDISVSNVEDPTQPQHLFDATVVVVDSTGAYHNYFAGTWEWRRYAHYNNALRESRVYHFGSDGRGSLASITYYSTNAPPVTETKNSGLDWWISIDVYVDGPVYGFRFEYDTEPNVHHGHWFPGFGLQQFQVPDNYFSSDYNVWTKR